MSEMDEQLQKNLKELENGVAEETVLSRMQGDESEVASLVKLAAEIRAADHPSPNPDFSQALRERVLAAASTPPQVKPGVPNRRDWNQWRWVLVPGFMGAALIVLVAFVSLVAMGIWLAGPSSARAAKLSGVTGQVEVSTAGSTTGWRPATDGEKVSTGQSIRTGPDSSAELSFFDGSVTSIGPEAQIALTNVAGRWGNVLQVRLTQSAGKTDNNVIPLRGSSSYFIVQTPSGTASVHGTSFSVLVNPKGESRFAVNTGKVTVSNGQAQVSLLPGQATTSQAGQAPLPPAYQFVVVDDLTNMQGQTWSASGTEFVVNDQTNMLASPAVGQSYMIEGRILQGKWVADGIEPVTDDSVISSFNGKIESIQPDTWVISGVPVLVNEATELDKGLAVGDAVQVKYVILVGNRWMALSIEALENEETEPTGTPTPNTTLTPTAVFTGTVTATITPTLTTTAVSCTGANPQPKGQELARRFGVSYNEIMGWFCQGFGFGEIDLAYSMSHEFGIPVKDIFALRRSGLGWGEIRKRLQHPTPTFTPTPVFTGTLTATPTLTMTATATLVVTPTKTITPTSTPVVSPTPQSTQVTNCTGANPQPKAMKLAQLYGVSYQEIMGWFCKGFGFGEIDLAYSLAAQYNLPVDSIFAMKSSGLGWGEIKQQLSAKHNGGNGNNGNKGNPHNKP